MASKIKITSPRAILVFPRLNRADTKYNEHGTYSADARLDMSEASTKALLEQISKHYKAHTGSAHPKFAPRKDKEAVFYFDQNDEGEFDKSSVVLKLRAKNMMTKKGELWDRKPKLFDAKGKPLSGSLKVGGGTSAKVAFEIDLGTITKTGVKFVRLIPTAVQIIDLVEFGNESASAFGFGEEDGFSADDDENEDFSNENSTEDNSGNEEGASESGEDFY